MIEGEFYGEPDPDSWKWVPFGIVLSCAAAALGGIAASIVIGIVYLLVGMMTV